MIFVRGQQIVCIVEQWFDSDGEPSSIPHLPKQNDIYRCAGYPSHTSDMIFLQDYPGLLFEANGFRPLVEKKPDISVFTALLTPTTAPKILEDA